MMRIWRTVLCVAGLVFAQALSGEAQGTEGTQLHSPAAALAEILAGGQAGGIRLQGDLVLASIAAPALTFPMSSSASGFTFYFNEQLQQTVPSSATFGSLFAERALTNGRGRLSIGLNYQRKAWKYIDGFDLDDIGVTATWVIRHPSRIDGVLMEPGEIESFRSSVSFTTDVWVSSVNFGLTDRIDIGTAIPIVRTHVDGSNHVTRIRLNGQEQTIVPSSRFFSTAQGLGDVFLRGKFNIHRSDAFGLALGGELRLPTGSAQDLLGVGTLVPKTSLIASWIVSRWSPHANVSYAWGDGGMPFRNYDPDLDAFRPGCGPAADDPLCRQPNLRYGYLALPDELNYVAGSEYELSNRVTLSADLIGRYLVKAARFERIERDGSRSDTGQVISRDSELFGQPGNLHSVVSVFGAKFRPVAAQRWLLMTNVIVPLNDRGLTSAISWSVGIDRAF